MKSKLDLTDFIPNEPGMEKHANVENISLTDLSWLSGGDTTIGYPSVNNPNDCRVQLASIWSHFQVPGSGQTSINNIVAPSEVTASVQDEHDMTAAKELITSVKKAMNLGLTGSDVSRVASQFPGHIVQSQTAELKKLASEQGLMGHVYIDLSAYPNRTAAQKHLGLRGTFAMYAVGTPYQEGRTASSDFMGKRVVSSMEYSPALLADYSNRLAATGLIPLSKKLASREELQAAFLGRLAETKEELPTDNGSIEDDSDNIGEDKIAAALGYIQASSNNLGSAETEFHDKAAALELQDKLVSGSLPLRTASIFKSRFASSSRVDKLSKLAGFIGAAAVDLSLYKSASHAIEALRGARIRPKFAFNGLISGNPMSWVSDFIDNAGMTPLHSPTDFTRNHCEDFCADMVGNGLADQESVGSLLSAPNAEPISIIIRVVEDSFNPLLLNKTHTIVDIPDDGDNYTPAEVIEPTQKLDFSLVRMASVKSLESGVKVSSVYAKVASLVGSSNASHLMQEALSKVASVSADALDACGTTNYNLQKTAGLVKTAKCKACNYCRPSGCAKQGLSFQGMRMASLLDNLQDSNSRTASSVDMSNYLDSMEMDVSIGSKRTSSDIDLSGGSIEL